MAIKMVYFLINTLVLCNLVNKLPMMNFKGGDPNMCKKQFMNV
jgi:hypothetical protein